MKSDDADETMWITDPRKQAHKLPWSDYTEKEFRVTNLLSYFFEYPVGPDGGPGGLYFGQRVSSRSELSSFQLAHLQRNEDVRDLLYFNANVPLTGHFSAHGDAKLAEQIAINLRKMRKNYEALSQSIRGRIDSHTAVLPTEMFDQMEFGLSEAEKTIRLSEPPTRADLDAAMLFDECLRVWERRTVLSVPKFIRRDVHGTHREEAHEATPDRRSFEAFARHAFLAHGRSVKPHTVSGAQNTWRKLMED